MVTTLDLNKLALGSYPTGTVTANPSSQQTPKSKGQRAYRFLKGPIPLQWLADAAALPGKSLAVGLIIWHLYGMSREDPRPISLGNSLPEKFGITRSAKYRALQWLATAQLITVDQKTGRNPLVKIVPVGDET